MKFKRLVEQMRHVIKIEGPRYKGGILTFRYKNRRDIFIFKSSKFKNAYIIQDSMAWSRILTPEELNLKSILKVLEE